MTDSTGQQKQSHPALPSPRFEIRTDQCTHSLKHGYIADLADLECEERPHFVILRGPNFWKYLCIIAEVRNEDGSVECWHYHEVGGITRLTILNKE